MGDHTSAGSLHQAICLWWKRRYGARRYRGDKCVMPSVYLIIPTALRVRETGEHCLCNLLPVPTGHTPAKAPRQTWLIQRSPRLPIRYLDFVLALQNGLDNKYRIKSRRHLAERCSYCRPSPFQLPALHATPGYNSARGVPQPGDTGAAACRRGAQSSACRRLGIDAR